MRAGRLDRRITIQAKTTAASSSGEPVETWTTVVARRSAGMAPVRGEERFGEPQLVAREQVEFTLRWAADVAGLEPNTHRIVHPALSADSPEETPDARSIHDVLAVHEIGRREGLRVVTRRRADVA